METCFPIKSCLVKPQSKIPWFTQDLRIIRHKRREAERLWRKTKLAFCLDIYKEASKTFNKQLLKNKKDYYAEKLAQPKNNSKKLFKITGNLLGKNQKIVLPECDDKQALSEKLNNFFNEQVNYIRSSIENKDLPESCEISSFNGPDCVTSLANVTQDEIKAVVRSSSNEHSQLDPIPTWLLKLVIMPLTQLITQLVNCSFKHADIPSLRKWLTLGLC